MYESSLMLRKYFETSSEVILNAYFDDDMFPVTNENVLKTVFLYVEEKQGHRSRFTSREILVEIAKEVPDITGD